MLERALIVDDSVPLHWLIRSQLRKEHLEFHSAYSGRDGLSMAASLRPSLILLDVDMSEMDGFEVCRRLKANAATTTIPVIFLTADFEIKDKVAGLNMGAVDYVTKPFKPEELSARMRASLRAKHSLDQKATVDGLTGLWNRKYLEEHLAVQMTQASRSGRAVAYIAGDLDGLKKINAKYGIPFGDEVIRSVANLLVSECRAEDAVCHLEGGRFGILVPAMGRAGAGRQADRLCKLIQEKLLVVHGNEVGVTCSFGVADSLVTGKGSLLERATVALGGAKLNGGSCVSVARPRRSRRAVAA
jgi:diguanylate cyclase (GGDEF)-like protein